MPERTRARQSLGRRELQSYEARGLLRLGEGPGPTAAELERARRIRRLRRDLGLSYESIDIVLRLVDRLEAAGAGRAESQPSVRITVVGR
jgi:hypothetical protein